MQTCQHKLYVNLAVEVKWRTGIMEPKVRLAQIQGMFIVAVKEPLIFI